jgi:hypothetical protein
VRPPESGVSLATILEIWSARRRRAHMWAMGHAAPKPIVFPEAAGPDLPEGNNTPLQTCLLGEAGGAPAGCATMARMKRTVPSPGRPSPLLDISRSSGEPVPRLRRTARCGRTGRRPCGVQNKRPHRGRPAARGPRAMAAGGRASEGGLGASTSGNGGAAGPGRAQAARVAGNCRREACPVP